MCLVDDVDAPLAAHDTAVLVALFHSDLRELTTFMPLPLGKGRKIGSEPGEVKSGERIARFVHHVTLPISSQAASATDRHECPLLIQAQRGPIYQHPPIWTVPMSPATPATVLEEL
jgi:hypothetical protein